ncbi:MAG: helix-turn-helix domain-containing protein [Spirochaetaceae bacterium]
MTNYDLLIADDEPLEREALRYIIERTCTRIGRVYDAANGREAEEVVSRVAPEIVLMDVKMPGLSGLEATRRILSVNPATRIVFLTAYDYFEYAQEAVRLGAADFIVKPAADERVTEVLSEIIAELDEEGRSREQHAQAEKRLREASQVLERELVSGLVGEALAPEEVARYFEILGLGAGTAEERRACTISAEISTDGYPARVETVSHRDALTRRCAAGLSHRFIRAGYRVLEARESGVVHFLLLAPPASEDEEVRSHILKTAREAAEAVYREFSIPVHLGVDPTLRRPELSHRGFRHASVARAEAAALGRPVAVIDGRDARARGELRASGLEEAGRDAYPYDLESSLFEAVRAGDRDRARRLAQQALDRLAVDEVRLAVIRRRLVELFTVVSRRLGIEPTHVASDGVTVIDRFETAGSFAHLGRIITEAAELLCRQPRGAGAEAADGRIEQVRRFIERNPERDISLEEAAGWVRLSPQYLSRAFKRHVGLSFVDYVHAVRVHRAKELLRDTNLSVKEISAAVGYGDANYFSRVFKQQARLTPSEYRNEIVLLGQNPTSGPDSAVPSKQTGENRPTDRKIL